MLDGIGGTEVFHIYISAAGDEVRRGAVGKAVPGFIAKVVDAEGNEVPRSTYGKLALQGPVGCRYLDDAQQADYVKNGWNYPGDSFVQDDDGYFFYQARARRHDHHRRLQRRRPRRSRTRCSSIRPCAECGVIGKPDADARHDRQGLLRAEARTDRRCRPREGAAGPRKPRSRRSKYPREIEFVSVLPRTETGKLQRFKLRQTEDNRSTTS